MVGVAGGACGGKVAGLFFSCSWGSGVAFFLGLVCSGFSGRGLGAFGLPVLRGRVWSCLCGCGHHGGFGGGLGLLGFNVWGCLVAMVMGGCWAAIVLAPVIGVPGWWRGGWVVMLGVLPFSCGFLCGVFAHCPVSVAD